MGSGTEVAKNAARMILTDDNFATIVRAVEQGRKLYDNLMKYVRFVLISLVAFVLTFLGATVLNIASGQPFTPGEVWSSGLTSLEEARRLGFIGICDTSDGRLPVCEAWMGANGKDAEQVAITTQRFFHGHPGPAITWKVYIVPPGK